MWGREKKLSKYSKQRFQCNTQKPMKGHKDKTETQSRSYVVYMNVFLQSITGEVLPLETALGNH